MNGQIIMAEEQEVVEMVVEKILLQQLQLQELLTQVVAVVEALMEMGQLEEKVLSF